MNPSLDLPFNYATFGSDAGSIRLMKQILADQSYIGAVICTGGRMSIVIDGKAYTISRGDLFFHAPFFSSRVVRIYKDFKAMALGTNYSHLLPVINRILDINSQVYIRRHPHRHLSDVEYDNAMTFIRIIQSEFEYHAAHAMSLDSDHFKIFREYVTSLAVAASYSVINLYFKDIPVQVEAGNRYDDIVQCFLSSLNKNFTMHRDVAFYAHEQNLSTGYFSGVIRRRTGRPALQWIVDMVIDYAKQMLQYTDVNIKQIATHLNFPSQTFFGKYFRQYTGVSPRAYRSSVRARKERGAG
ncbi:MAG: helix-turn-helix transcriptional regulator [Paludibacteraceae bacterium]|nr:helix-turn-helix transcriptional regulator [Paludibacteraceae bacterium]